MKIKKSIWASLAFSTMIALSMSVGCKDDDGGDGDGDGDGVDLSDCEGLCAAAAEAECGTEADCLDQCEGVSMACATEVDAYFDCAKDYEEVSCLPDYALGIVSDCGEEILAVQACALGGDGDGGAGGGGGAGGAGN